MAHADGTISDVETERMNRILRDFSTLTMGQAELVLRLTQQAHFTAQDQAAGPQVSAMLREVSTEKQRREIVGCLYAVAAADDIIYPEEDNAVTSIAGEMGVPDEHVLRVRAAYERFLV